MKIIAIAGLPASGKTYLGRKLAKTNHFAFVDDLIGDYSDFEKKMPRFNGVIERLCNPYAYKGSVICDSNLVLPSFRLTILSYLRKLYGGQYSIEWVYFENNLVRCIENLYSYFNYDKQSSEALDSEVEFTKLLSEYYYMPKEYEVLKVLSKEERAMEAQKELETHRNCECCE